MPVYKVFTKELSRVQLVNSLSGKAIAVALQG